MKTIPLVAILGAGCGTTTPAFDVKQTKAIHQTIKTYETTAELPNSGRLDFDNEQSIFVIVADLEKARNAKQAYHPGNDLIVGIGSLKKNESYLVFVDVNGTEKSSTNSQYTPLGTPDALVVCKQKNSSPNLDTDPCLSLDITRIEHRIYNTLMDTWGHFLATGEKKFPHPDFWEITRAYKIVEKETH